MKGAVALVTGATGLIGRALGLALVAPADAQELKGEEAGAAQGGRIGRMRIEVTSAVRGRVKAASVMAATSSGRIRREGS